MALLGLPMKLAESGDKKGDDESNGSHWRFVVLVLRMWAKGEPGILDLSLEDLRSILASLDSI